MVEFWSRTLFLASRQLPSSCTLKQQRESKAIPFFSNKGTGSLRLVPFVTSFNISHVLMDTAYTTVTWGREAKGFNIWGDTVHSNRVALKISWAARCRWLTSIILATWEAEIRRSTVQGQPNQTVNETPFLKIIRAKWTDVDQFEFDPRSQR
jgi:hypothetical protein